ncbi:MurR/RpiR family transcriptional regulator [Granulosicoccus sp. 3-233]|uniref:MurR/RpiR family transcriptional regulator n=1 Tax=Granulosicoccus sp. 3-233 TaxID=3417969 RepID=UPI003D338344
MSAIPPETDDASRSATSSKTIDIVGRLRNRLALGKDAERRLIETILADLQFAAHASIADIAVRAGVSEPTITRLARALGFAGTRDMRIHLAQALAIGGAYLRGPSSESTGNASSAGAVAAVAKGAHAALELMTVGLVDTDIDAMAGKIAVAGQILVCGTGGGSSMAAVELQNRLFRLGLKVVSQTDPQLQRMNASVLGEGDVIIGFSLSGKAQSVVDALNIAGQYGAYSLAVTGPESLLSGNADALLPLHFEEDGNIFKPSSARYTLLVAVDIISMATAHIIGSSAIESLRRVRQSLASRDILDPNLPLGD